MTRIAIKSLSQRGILQKLIVSILLMAIIPLVLIIYLLHTEASEVLLKNNVKATMIFMICSICIGYILSRKIIISVVKLARDMQDVTQGNLSKKIKTSENDEVDMLAGYFNQITGELEKNIEDLKESKKVIQDVLLRISSAMGSDKKIDSIMELTLETLNQALNASSGTIMILKEDKLKIMVSYGVISDIRGNISLKEEESIIVKAYKDQKTQNVSRADGAEQLVFEKETGFAYKSILCAPLMYKGGVLGVISMHDKKNGDSFSEDDVVLIENLAGQMAIAIENSRLNQDIERTYVETISTLALAVEAKDPYTRGHAKRVTDFVLRLADEFSLDKDVKDVLRDAALLHDIGKIGVKDEILLKPGSLTPEERRHMQLHPIIGENILRPIHSLNKIAYLVRHHHERVDGGGYPDELTKEYLSLSLKILTVSDAYDAMTSDRPYRKAMTKDEACQELKRCRGTYFDSKVVDVFLKML
ncbi:MAG: HD domain-containing protein [Candidatus Omnitrophica bacterium]|nr:HD domain-containing protein [Candidatus Omnitrophota bacterium]